MQSKQKKLNDPLIPKLTKDQVSIVHVFTYIHTYIFVYYRIARKFGGELNLAVWWTA